MHRFTVNEILGVLAGTIIYIILFILHEYLFQYFAYPIHIHPTGTNYTLMISIIMTPIPAVVAAITIAYIQGSRGLFLGCIIGVASAVLGVAVDRLLFNQFYGSDYWFTFSHVIAGVVLPSILAGGVGELLLRNRNE